jgi:hypothetical protein
LCRDAWTTRHRETPTKVTPSLQTSILQSQPRDYCISSASYDHHSSKSPIISYSDSPQSSRCSYSPSEDNNHLEIDLDITISLDDPKFGLESDTQTEYKVTRTNIEPSDGTHGSDEEDKAKMIARAGSKRACMKACSEKNRGVKNNIERKRRAENTDWVREMQDRITERGLTGELKRLSLANRNSSGLEYNKMAVMGSFVNFCDGLVEENELLRRKLERLQERFNEMLQQELEKRWERYVDERERQLKDRIRRGLVE